MTICTNCRRIQDDGRACVVCAGKELHAWPAAIALLREAQVVGVGLRTDPRGWGCLGLVFTVVMAFFLAFFIGWLTETLGVSRDLAGFMALGGFGLALFGGYVAQWHPRLRAKHQMRFAARPERPALPAHRDRFHGTARAHQHTVQSLLSPESCLVSAVIARRSDGKDICDRVEAADFWLDGAGEPILVCGALTVGGAPSRQALSGRAALHADLPGLTVYEIMVKPGAQVSIEGTVGDEVLPELGYRGGSARVMRGVPGAPVEVRVV
jgi:hypothetical protein